MMSPPDLQVYLRPCMTLNFDLLTPEVDRFMPSPRGPLVFDNRQTDGRTDGQTKERTSKKHYTSGPAV